MPAPTLDADLVIENAYTGESLLPGSSQRLAGELEADPRVRIWLGQAPGLLGAELDAALYLLAQEVVPRRHRRIRRAMLRWWASGGRTGRLDAELPRQQVVDLDAALHDAIARRDWVDWHEELMAGVRLDGGAELSPPPAAEPEILRSVDHAQLENARTAARRALEGPAGMGLRRSVPARFRPQREVDGLIWLLLPHVLGDQEAVERIRAGLEEDNLLVLHFLDRAFVAELDEALESEVGARATGLV